MDLGVLSPSGLAAHRWALVLKLSSQIVLAHNLEGTETYWFEVLLWSSHVDLCNYIVKCLALNKLIRLSSATLNYNFPSKFDLLFSPTKEGDMGEWE